MKKFMFVMMTLMCLSIPAYAAVFETIASAGLLNNVVVPALVGLTGILVTMLIRKFEKITGIKLKAEQHAYVRKLAEESVQYVAEHSASEMKSGSTVTSKMKSRKAIAKLMKDVPELTKSQADEAIHAALARVQGQGATVKQVR